MGSIDFTDPDELERLAEDAEDADWGPLERIPDGLSPVDPFVFDLLPAALRPWIKDIAERMQCPADYPAVSLMVALASVVGRQVTIRPKARDDWTVTPNLWGAVIGRPALLKTPAIQEPMRMVNALEASARDEFAKDEREHAAEAMVREARAKRLKAEVAGCVNSGDETAAKEKARQATDEPPAPTRRRYVTQDCTVEKLGELLRDNPRGILVYRDELIGLLRTLDKEGHENARSFLLECWNGTGSYTSDRIQRGTIEVEAACVSIIGAIQPGPFQDYMASAVAGGAGDDGLVQRFQLAVWPDTGRGWVNVDRWPDAEARQAAQAIFRRLDSLDTLLLGAHQQDGDPLPWLRFDDEAQEAFNGWRAALEVRLRDDDLPPAMESHLAKFRSLVPSLALLAHLVDAPDKGSVGLESLFLALAWAEYLETHARRIYGPALAPEVFTARELAKRLDSLPAPFTARDVYSRHWRGLDIASTVQAIRVLIDFGYLREMPEEGPIKGRPTIRYEVRPSLRRVVP